MLPGLVAEGATQYGMQTFDQSVLGLIRDGLITEEEGLKNCSHPNELILKLKGILGASDRVWQPVDAARDVQVTPLERTGNSASLLEPQGDSGRPGLRRS